MTKRAFTMTVLAILLVALTACSAPTIAPAATQPPASTVTIAPTEAPTEAPTAVPTKSPTAPQVEGMVGEGSIGDPYIPKIGNTGYDVQHYTLRLQLDPAVKQVYGETTIEAVSTLENLVELSLDFSGFEISAITQGSSSLNYSREGDKLIVELTAPLAVGVPFTLDIQYAGEPTFEPSQYVPFIPSLGLQYPPPEQPGGSLYIVSEPDGAHYVFPCNDHPRDKAAFRIELSVPSGMAGAANGVLVETQKDVSASFGDGRPGDLYVWEENHPMATYLATAAVGPYERIEATSPNGTPLRSYAFVDQTQAFEDNQPLIGEALDWMSEMFGPYPFDTFGYAQVMALGASLETQTMVILDTQSSESTMVHEMSHMWFGDWVSLDSWQDIWRNEGFATYIAWMWEARSDPNVLEQQVKQVQLMYENNPSDHPLNDPPPEQMFGMDSYYRGALLVHDLRQAMGDEAFFQGLRNYLQQYGGGTASFEQFKAVMEEAAGQELGGVFEEDFK